jgi:hypothetical protein
MADINAGKISYINTNADATLDNFSFVVLDGGGGWLGTPSLPIKIDVNTSSEDVVDFDHFMKIYPNPASGNITIELQEAVIYSKIRINDMQGRLLFNQVYQTLNTNQKLDISNLPEGVYLLTLETDKFLSSKKVVVIRR